MRPEHQNLKLVQKPKTFMDLNETTYTVIDQTQTKGKSNWEKTETGKPEVNTPQQSRQREFWNTTKSGNEKWSEKTHRPKNKKPNTTTRQRRKRMWQKPPRPKQQKQKPRQNRKHNTYGHNNETPATTHTDENTILRGKVTRRANTSRQANAVEMEFLEGIIIALLDSQAEKTYVQPWIAEKYGKKVNKRKTTVRMADGHTRETDGKCWIEAIIATLELAFEAEILRELVTDILIGHDFLTQQQAAWDYNAAKIHLGAEKRTTVSWCR